MKAFPTEALTHTPISAVLDLIKTNDLKPDQVDKVQIRSLARAADILSDPSKYDPRTKETADHSLPYVIAAAIVDRQVTPAQFEMKKIMDPAIRAQLKKVEVVADPEIEKVFPALQRVVVNITTIEGRTFSKQLDYPKGDPRNPLTDAEVEEKFAALADGVLSAGAQKKLIDAIWNLEKVGSVSKLMALMKADVKGKRAKNDDRQPPHSAGALACADGRSLPGRQWEGIMGQTIVEKIAQAHLAEGPKRPLRTGDFVSIHPRYVMTHDNTSAVMSKFKGIGAKKIHDPRQLVFALDHDIQNQDESNQKKYRAIEAFAKEHGVDFYPAGSGIGHQLMVERGYVLPRSFVVASDSHSNMYGALGGVGTPIVRTDAAAVWATGDFWWQIPRSIRVVLEGKLPEGATGKDVIIALCGLYNHDEVLNAAVAFSGPGVASLSMDARFSISNMSTEWGPLVGWVPVDEVTIACLRGVHQP